MIAIQGWCICVHRLSQPVMFNSILAASSRTVENCRKIDVYCSFKFLQLPFDNDEECRAINVDETSPPPSEQDESLVIFLLISC